LSSAVTGYIRAMLDADTMPIAEIRQSSIFATEETRIHKMVATKMQQLP
jgi:hypothetical protein